MNQAKADSDQSPVETLLQAIKAGIPPDLGDVIQSTDVSQKGTGKYVADYVNWARVAHLMHQHAPGWQFHLRTTSTGEHVWSAPNGTAYMVGFFVGPDGQQTPDFPQAVMDNRNDPIKFQAVSARDVTDTHRRCWCTAAAATFGLAWQLWAKEPVEDPHARPGEDQVLAEARKRAIAAGLTPVGAAAAALELTQGASQAFNEIPRAALQRIASAGLSAETVSKWNGTQQQASAAATAAVSA